MYDQEPKIKARESVLQNAIKVLTDGSAAIVDVNYIRKVKQAILNREEIRDKEVVDLLLEEDILRWENFYKSKVRKKSANELQVAYLSGPNPENDLEVMVKFGILPENIWAFESDNKIYDKAVMSALSSSYPFIKIYKGKIEDFVKVSGIRFDIIYLDFCGTITSKTSLEVLTVLFEKQILTTQSVLITNFAYPDNKPELEKHNLLKLCTNYIYNKEFVETEEGGGVDEGAIVNSKSFQDLYNYSIENPYNMYSQFITRFIMDLSTFIIPYQRLFLEKNAWNLFFKNKIDKVELTEYYQDFLHEEPHAFSIITGLSSEFLTYTDTSDLEDLYNQAFYEYSICKKGEEESNTGFNSPEEQAAWNKYFTEEHNFKASIETDLKKIFNFISIDTNSSHQLYERMKKLSYVITGHCGKSTENEYSEKLLNISKNWSYESQHIFCDLFLFHQVKDILLRQISNPYYYNTKQLKRWTYKAKDTRMFLDMFVFDECRYVFDWLPTIDMFEHGISDMSRNLIFRFGLDGISKHNHWYNTEYLSGTAVTSMFEDHTGNFDVHELEPRIVIN